MTVVEISATTISNCEWYMKKNVLWFRDSELHRRKNRAIKINPRLLTLRTASARRVSTTRIKRWIITFVNRERVTAWRICNHDLQNFDNYALNTWLKYSEMALVCAYFLISHTNVLVIFGSRTLIVCHATKLAGIELCLQFFILRRRGVQDREVPGVATQDRSPDQSPWVRPISPSHQELRGTRRGGPPGWSRDQVVPGVHTLEWIFSGPVSNG